MNEERAHHQSLIASRRVVDWVTDARRKWRPESLHVRQCQPAQWRLLGLSARCDVGRAKGERWKGK